MRQLGGFMTNYRIPDMIKKYTEYEMIRMHTDLPEFPEVRTKLLFTFLNKNRERANVSELYSFVTSLAQMGLDTHDMVTEMQEAEDAKTIRSRQLKVLAGDFFSSNFYHLLSQAGEVQVIRQLSTAISEINHMKMDLYALMKKARLTAEEYIRYCIEIKMHLYLSFTHHFQDQYASLWPKVLHGFTYCEVLIQEILRSNTLHQFRGGLAFWQLVMQGTKDEVKQLQDDQLEHGRLQAIIKKYDPTAMLYAMLDQQWKELCELIELLESNKLRDEVLLIGEPFRHFVSSHQVGV